MLYGDGEEAKVIRGPLQVPRNFGISVPQADAQVQERSLNQLQASLSDASAQMAAKDTEREA